MNEPQKTKSMHDLVIPTYCNEGHRLKDYSTSSNRVTVHFREHTKRCVEFIEKYDVIVGSVAWLTSIPILRALAKKGYGRVQIVLQKEDFLRPDGTRMKDVRAAYASIRGGWRDEFGGVLSEMSISGDGRLGWGIEPLRCVGNHNADKNPAFPRAHHKFLVGCRHRDSRDMEREQVVNDFGDEVNVGCIPSPGVPWLRQCFQPHAVWTGSFNLTANAERSFENVVVIEDEAIAQAYYNEWNQLAALSEPLDWDSEWCHPERRIVPRAETERLVELALKNERLT